MALSKRTKEIAVVALADKKAANELTAAIDSGNSQAASVAPIATPASATAEDAANKVNQVIAALKAAKLMA